MRQNYVLVKVVINQISGCEICTLKRTSYL
nr:MAG TPA: hypothetical protein [Caudoviricetes sp.]